MCERERDNMYSERKINYLLVLLSEIDGELNPGVHIGAPVLVPRLLVQHGQAAAVQLHLARNLRAYHVNSSTLH